MDFPSGIRTRSLLAGLLAAGLLTACGGDSDNDYTETPSEPQRQQDSRTFAVNEATLPFDETGVTGHANASRWWGVRPSGAGYRIEVPENWNGQLVMYAHGYRGEGEELTVGNPSIRQHLLDEGYAWAASSYSTNYYDVRTGVEDTNELALAFNDIAEDNGRTLAAPTKTYIMGHSMGGHVTAAAIEEETYRTANNKVQYNGAVPMCGVVGDTFEFQYLAQVTMAAQHFAHMVNPDAPPLTAIPATNFDVNAINDVVWDTPPSISSLGVLSEEGEKMQALVRNLSGGQRPIADIGFRTYYWGVVMGTGGRGGDVNGILAGNLTGNAGVTYQFDNFPPLTSEEQAFNDTILRVEGNPAANGLRSDGLRWIPVINGEFNIPVVSLQGLGDLYVPFRHGQIYRERAEANGNGGWLVQRAIRSPGHCDYTLEEQETAFDDMINWEQNSIVPDGDDFLDPATVANDDFGCQFSSDRAGLPSCTPP
ncbi:alpha/beta hydrolase [Alcanivorax marinus]|uniref:Alpha/beta hydrolase n=1 Tax=Alloalcanivorax marinus TaxID=1177169 RepID=A0A9Q3UM83_9GAMM|nr:alpha/beta hydrolase [Alloalcanivorax marinus]MCC4307588.1 alpha/beta hydrolase [Alloalcanivorax marinus]